MATVLGGALPKGRENRFFLTMAIAITIVMIAGFSVQLAAGRSSFGAPVHVHVHAVLFFGWVTLFLLQNVFVARDTLSLHRKLGWIGAGWAAAMVVVGIYTTVLMVQAGHVPFFFKPAYFLVMNPMTVLTFAGLTGAAIVARKRTDRHRRLMLCGMAVLTGPAFGRLLPVPFMVPFVGIGVFAATMIWPAIGMVRDWRTSGRVNPAWWTGVGAMVAMLVVTELVGNSALGATLYHAVVADTPGASVAPLEFGPFPPMG